MRWNDLDWQQGTLTIARIVWETVGGWAEKGRKTHQVRRIDLDDFALAVLQRHHVQVEALASTFCLTVLEDGFIFSRSPIGAEPYRPDVVSKTTQRVAKAAKVNTHLHAPRHSLLRRPLVPTSTR